MPSPITLRVACIAILVCSVAPAVLGQYVAQSPSEVKQLEGQVKNLEKRQEIVLESIKNSFDRATWVLGVAAGMITILTFLQYFRDNKIVTAQEKQISESKDLSRKNIESVTNLVGSMQTALNLHASAQAALKDVAELQVKQNEENQRWATEIVAVDKMAIELSSKCTRKAHNNVAVQRYVRDFHDRYEIFTRAAAGPASFNANTHFILGFHYRIENKYEEALQQFQRALDLAQLHKDLDPKPSGYASVPGGTSLQEWLTKLQNICAFHKAIIVYNLGRYEDAKRSFEDAISYDPLDCQSLTYVPEVMFLGRLASFGKIEAAFEAAAKRIESLTPQQEVGFAMSGRELLSQLYMKLGNCYMASTADPEFQNHHSLSVAEAHMRRAVESDPGSILARFSLAQVIHLQQPGAQESLQLFTEVFTRIKDQLSVITETKILVMYYYILALCSTHGAIEGERPSLYTMRIYELVPQLPAPEQLRIFSPRTKNDLSVHDFLTEIRAFDTTPKSVSGPVYEIRLARSLRRST